MIFRFFKHLFYTLFNNNSNDIRSLATRDYILESSKCKFHYSSNMVIEFESEKGEKIFFRMCRRMPKKKSFETYIAETLTLFFRFIHIKNSNIIIKNAMKDISDRNNLKLLKNIHNYYYQHFYEMCAGIIPDFSMVGFPSLNAVNFEGEHVHFLQFLRGAINDFKLNHHIKAGDYFNNSANRIMATSNLSELFSLENVIPKALIGKVVIDGEDYYGTVMKEAKGIAPAYIRPSERIPFNECFVTSLLNLEYFDFICYQTDRRIDNYNIEKINGVVKALSAFDNDSPKTFFTLPFLPKKMSVPVSALIRKNSMNRPFMDRHFYDQLLIVTYSKVKKATRDYLNIFQCICVYQRCKAIKKAAKTSSSNLMFFNYVFDNYKYRNTYLDFYLNDISLLERIEKYGG